VRRTDATYRDRVGPVSYAALADLILVVHFAFVLFIVGGLALIIAGALRGWAWVRRPAFRWLHFAAMLFVALESAIGMACPLTVWEEALRGGDSAAGSFIGRWVATLLYWQLPEWIFTVVYAVMAGAVAYVMWRCPPRAGAQS
jgi:hypothetical protein